MQGMNRFFLWYPHPSVRILLKVARRDLHRLVQAHVRPNKAAAVRPFVAAVIVPPSAVTAVAVVPHRK
jgi:hypothetical protein